MAKILPFRGLLYNINKVSIEDVLSPPYDIITPEFQDELYKKSPYNIVRIDFGKEYPEDNEKNNKYIRAKKYLNNWIKKGILIQSEKPSFYIYEISYDINNQKKKLIGFLGLLKLEAIGKGIIYPHECTYSIAKQDRLNLLRSCKANISPIFSLYKSTTKGYIPIIYSKITKTKPYIKVGDFVGAHHRLWKIDNEDDIALIKKELEDKPVFIADGHHRYETAIEFQKEMQEKKKLYSEEEPFNYVLMFFTNMLNEGITILPTHRLVKKVPKNINSQLSKYFNIEPVKEGLLHIKERMSDIKHVFGFYKDKDKKWYLLKYKKIQTSEFKSKLKDVDVVILHELIFKKILKINKIEYEMDIYKAIEKVRKGQYGAAFFLNPTKVEDVEKAALSSVRMPPKSTYFYPKLLTGIVINRLSTPDGSK